MSSLIDETWIRESLDEAARQVSLPPGLLDDARRGGGRRRARRAMAVGIGTVAAATAVALVIPQLHTSARPVPVATNAPSTSSSTPTAGTVPAALQGGWRKKHADQTGVGAAGTTADDQLTMTDSRYNLCAYAQCHPGDVVVSGDTITFDDPQECPQGPRSYRWSLTGSTLRFTPQSTDSCVRGEVLKGAWSLQSGGTPPDVVGLDTAPPDLARVALPQPAAGFPVRGRDTIQPTAAVDSQLRPAVTFVVGERVDAGGTPAGRTATIVVGSFPMPVPDPRGFIAGCPIVGHPLVAGAVGVATRSGGITTLYVRRGTHTVRAEGVRGATLDQLVSLVSSLQGT